MHSRKNHLMNYCLITHEKFLFSNTWDFVISCDFACRADFYSFNFWFSNCFWYLTLNTVCSVSCCKTWNCLFFLSAKFLICWFLHDSDLAENDSDTFARFWTHKFVDAVIILICVLMICLVLSCCSFIFCVSFCLLSVSSHHIRTS